MIREHMRIAAIDLGTNSFHMVIVEESSGKGIVEIDRVKDMICIGRGSISTKMLNEDAMDAGVATLKRFVLLASRHGVSIDNIIAFATSAIREARNKDIFLQKVLDETGLNVKVISGPEEAEFIYYGVRNAVTFTEKPDLLFDIGGGSVEFIIADNCHVHLLESRKIGVARMLERFITTDPISKHELNLLDQFFCAELHSSVEKARELEVHRAIASSGTAQNIARMIRFLTGRDSEVVLNNSSFSRKEFQKLYRQVIGLSASERSKLTGLDEKRVDLIIPGLILIDVIFRLFKLREIVISDYALREGMVIHHLAQHGPGSSSTTSCQVDIRRESIMELAYRCHWDKAHSSHIAMLCLQLFDELQPLHDFDATDRELLEYAALLHNIGTFISISAHHKHSQYIIINGELRGFTPLEITIIANIARYHRKSSPSEKHELYAQLKPRHRKTVDMLAAILRIANGLDRGHRCAISSIHAEIDREQINFCLESRDEPDIEIWAARRMKSLLESVTGRTIAFRFLGGQ
ncbi:MAG: Ppx/GppA family phosphatase [Prosthecochloris sp.]|uniref:Ppx/GppA phosphatase family protein n=1 Tax=Prosthecochloris sp. TaxID=290513 RepID=UPI0013CBE54B|nr:Ppx/GppA phosphatase family protein [Prosthecochloris sp.]NEX12957.1 Ppx/GppA family phosphatase [Prosthecochloris sp.]